MLISFVVADALLPEASRPLVSISERKGEEGRGDVNDGNDFTKYLLNFLDEDNILFGSLTF